MLAKLSLRVLTLWRCRTSLCSDTRRKCLRLTCGELAEQRWAPVRTGELRGQENAFPLACWSSASFIRSIS